MSLIRTLSRTRGPAVLVTLAVVRDGPRAAGARMVVTAEGTTGTIGGGDLELSAMERARAMLAEGGARLEWSAPLCTSSDRAVLLYECLDEDRSSWADLTAAGPRGRWVVVTYPDAASDRLFIGVETVLGARPDGSVGDWIVNEARSMLDDPAATSGVRIPPGESGDSCLFFDLIRPPEFRVVVFGAGHVGRAIVEILSAVPCEVIWIDGRTELLSGDIGDNVESRPAPNPEAEAQAVEAGSYCVVSSHSHDLDQMICGRLLDRDDLPFVGLIGSRRKRASFEEHWRRHGMRPERVARLVCPVGIEGITGRSPGEIAVAVVAQMLQIRDRVA